MEQIFVILRKVLDIFRYHKKKVVFYLASTLMFSFLLFPFDDLADFVTTQVSKQTNNQVFLQFDSLGINLLPTPNVEMEKVQIDTPTLPTINTNALKLSPNIASLLTFKPGFNLTAKGFLEGRVDLDFQSTEAIEDADGIWRQKISFDAESISISSLQKTFLTSGPMDIGIKISGQADMEISLLIDPTFKDQPEGEFELTIPKLDFPGGTVPTQMGPIDFPKITLEPVKLNGRIVNSELIVNEVIIGNKENGLYGTIKGKTGITLAKLGPEITPRWGQYEFKVDLFVSDTMSKTSLGIMLGFLDSFRSKTNDGSRYKVALSALRFGAPPKMSAF